MASVIRSPSVSHAKAFNSVFPKGSFHPRKQPQTKQPKSEAYATQIKPLLHLSLKRLLCMGEDGLRYGLERNLREGAPFLLPLDTCPPMQSVREPTHLDRTVQQSKLADTSIMRDLRKWQKVLGADQLKKLIASAVCAVLSDYVNWAYGGCYRDDAIKHLEYWVNNVLAETIKFLLAKIDSFTSGTNVEINVSIVDLQKWQEMAMTRLGALRVDEMFEMIVDWDEEVNGIDDLKQFITNPATRSYLTNNFANILSTRLLHPGASTVEILQLYISIIRAFRKLDPKGVLLDRVARRVRRYLRERDDTVRVIVTGLLSDVVDENGEPLHPDPETLTELALELSRRDASDGKIDDSEFDWHNMNWMPDPIDAAPDYMKSKNTDVIGSLTSLFESKDVFVKELQTTLADRLLMKKANFDQEIGVLEHLKIRFGDSALQGCEVMLRDVLDSRKVDNVIRRDQGMQDDAGQPLKADAELHAKILSRLFWPSMSDQAFKVPSAIREQQLLYEKGFESLKQSRKLTWLNAIGQVEVELELEDRTFRDEVLPWQASVIDAFQSDDDKSVARSVDNLSVTLEMKPALVRSACIFWVSKRILSETAKDEFTVLERLPEGDDVVMSDAAGRQDAATAAAEVAAAQAVKEVEEAERRQKMAMYHQFVISMLTNQGAMPLPRIAMMLGIVVPGGFPFSNEELKEFLGGMVKDGSLEIGHGGAYKVAIT